MPQKKAIVGPTTCQKGSTKNKFIKNIVRIKHPNLYIFIESIQMCNASATTALVQKQNEIINVPKILSFKENKLQSFCTTFNYNNDNEILYYLKKNKSADLKMY